MGYYKDQIANREIRDAASRLAAHELISKEQLANVFSIFKDNLYVPGFFVRVGLFIFTLILVNAGLGIFFMLFSGVFSDEVAAGGMLIFYAAIVFWALEFFTGKRFHFRSGIDDCLLYTGISFLVGGLVIAPQLYDPVQICLIALPVLILATWRYADSFVALTAFICFYILLFLVLKDYAWSRTAMPFIYLVISAVFLIVFNRKLQDDRLDYYDRCFKMLKVAALVMLYASVNYFVVREGNMLLNDIPEEVYVDAAITPSFYEIPLSFLFIGFTILLPVVYIYFGLQQRDRLLLWTGIGILILSVLTIRYRFHVMPYEYALTIGGIIMVTGCWWLIRKLKRSPGKFTFVPDPSGHQMDLLNAEAFVIAQTFVKPVKEPQEGFGGGSFGGGGAGGSI
jgi:hypothetical protein